MPIKSYVLDRGTLSLGAVGAIIDATAQVTQGAVEWAESVTDSTPVLSGEEQPGDVTYTATLTGTVIQDLSAGGLTDFTWTNKGAVVPFTFVPADLANRTVTGNVRISPLKVGGTVRSKPTSDFTWACIGEPVLGTQL